MSILRISNFFAMSKINKAVKFDTSKILSIKCVARCSRTFIELTDGSGTFCLDIEISKSKGDAMDEGMLSYLGFDSVFLCLYLFFLIYFICLFYFVAGLLERKIVRVPTNNVGKIKLNFCSLLFQYTLVKHHHQVPIIKKAVNSFAGQINWLVSIFYLPHLLWKTIKLIY